MTARENYIFSVIDGSVETNVEWKLITTEKSALIMYQISAALLSLSFYSFSTILPANKDSPEIYGVFSLLTRS